MLLRILLPLLLTIICQAAIAGECDSGESDVEKRKSAIDELVLSAPPSADADPAFPGQLPAASKDGKTKEAYESSLQGYYNYRISGLEHRSNVFKWQLLSAKIIFSVVLVIVTTGILLAITQFRADLRRLKNGAIETMPNTEIEATVSGVKMSSSLVGIVILTLSLAFFYLYLIYVFPITELF